MNRPQYGLPKARNHWFHTYHRYHTHNLKLEPSVYDLFLLYFKGFMAIRTQKESFLRVLACLQTDDAVCVGNKNFIELEHNQKHFFDSKDLEIPSPQHEVKFNGAIVHQNGNSITLFQI